MPTPIITRDQLKLLKTDNITDSKAKTFYDLEIQPKSIEEIVPLYLERYKEDNLSNEDKNKIMKIS